MSQRPFTLSAQTLRWVIAALVLAALAALLVIKFIPRSRAPQPADLAAPAQPGGDALGNLCSSRNVAGVGLRGEYFSAPHWQGPLLASRIDDSVDFAGDFALPAGTAAPRSARWRGWVKTPFSGSYRFHVQPAGARVRVANQWVAGPDALPDAAVQGVGGRFVPIEIDMEQLSNQPPPTVRLEWTTPYGARFVIPKAYLNLPTDTAVRPAS